MTGERDELPAGWFALSVFIGGWMAVRKKDNQCTRDYPAYRPIIAAAWRIVDAEREAADGR